MYYMDIHVHVDTLYGFISASSICRDALGLSFVRPCGKISSHPQVSCSHQATLTQSTLVRSRLYLCTCKLVRSRLCACAQL